MRTEEELRAALASLEDQAPLATSVLTPIPPNGSRRLARRPLPPLRLAGVVAGLGVAVAAGTAVAVVIATQSPGRVGSYSQALPSHQVVRTKLLDALSAAASEIVYDHMEIVSSDITGLSGTPDPFLPGLATGTASESWYYPWRANPGQQVRGRLLTLNPGGAPAQDIGVSYPEPTEVQEVATASEYTHVNYASRTWSKLHNSSGWIADSLPGAPLSIWELIHNEPWSVVGRTELGGQLAIKLKLDGSGSSYLWVDAQTYRPLRETYNFGGGALQKRINGVWHSLGAGQASIVTDYQYLAPTAANLANLTVPIPSGFRQTTAP